MKSDLELLEECLEKAKKALISMEAEQQDQATFAHIQGVTDGLFSSIGVPNIAHQIQSDQLQQKIAVLEAQRARMLSDNKEEILIIGDIEEINQYIIKNVESTGKYKLVRMKDNGRD